MQTADKAWRNVVNSAGWTGGSLEVSRPRPAAARGWRTVPGLVRDDFRDMGALEAAVFIIKPQSLDAGCQKAHGLNMCLVQVLGIRSWLCERAMCTKARRQLLLRCPFQERSFQRSRTHGGKRASGSLRP